MAEQKKTYLQKQAALIDKMRGSDGKLDEMSCSFLTRAFTAFPEYANVVIRQQTMIPIWNARYEGQDLRDRVSEIDRQRHNAHEAAISSANMLNRMCAKNGLEPFFDGNTADRYEVADFVGDYVNEVYNHGIGKADGQGRELTGMERAVHQRREDYDTSIPGKRLREVNAKFGDIVAGSPSDGTEYQA